MQSKKRFSSIHRLRQWKTRIPEIWSLLKRERPERRKQRNTARELILQRFEAWLDDVLAREEPLEGIDKELLSRLDEENGDVAAGLTGNGTDLYTAWSAIGALTQEVKLQGRAFRTLSERLESLPGLSESVDRLVEAQRDGFSDAGRMAEYAREVIAERENAWKREAQTSARREVVNLLLDLRERLIIGSGSAGEGLRKLDEYRSDPGRLKRFFGLKNPVLDEALQIVGSLKKGYRLGLDRLDEEIKEFGASEIDCEGKLFDPSLMTALDIEERTDLPDGTVLEVYRTGYVIDGELLRPAQVKVARAP